MFRNIFWLAAFSHPMERSMRYPATATLPPLFAVQRLADGQWLVRRDGGAVEPALARRPHGYDRPLARKGAPAMTWRRAPSTFPRETSARLGSQARTRHLGRQGSLPQR